jgi:hypothetical protein
MPNHVTTRCVVTGPAASIAAFREKMIRPSEEDGKLFFDFEQILPMPKCLRDTVAGWNASVGIEILTGSPPKGMFAGTSAFQQAWVKELGLTTYEELITWAERERPEIIDQGRKCLAARAETGFDNWYDWSVATWGTKWNAYSFESDIPDGDDDRFEFRFETAWSFPTPVFEALSKAHPDLVFECFCFDDGWNFAGRGEFNGKGDFTISGATDELYEETFGFPYERDDEDDE